jgi:hypothetical protein
MIVGKELFGAHTVPAPIGAIHRDRHTGQFRDHMAIGLGVTFKPACLSLGPGSASSPPLFLYTYSSSDFFIAENSRNSASFSGDKSSLIMPICEFN